MLGLNTSYLKYIILAVLLYGLVLVVNNKLLKNDEQTDTFKTEKQEELNNVVEQLTNVTKKLTGLVEKFENMNNNNQDDEENEDDEDDDVEDVEDVEDVKHKVNKSTESFKKKKKEGFKKGKKYTQTETNEPFTNYTTGVASTFGGDYLLL